jgi:uncharacterized protein
MTLMKQIVPAGSGMAWKLAAGERLRVTDVEGGQTGDVFAVAADDLGDGLSNGRTFDYGETLRLSTGSVLYSRRSRPLLRIADDEVGVHDFLYAPCSQEMYEIGYGATEPRPPPIVTAGQGVTFVAERDILVAVTACPAAKASGGRTRPLGVEISPTA